MCEEPQVYLKYKSTPVYSITCTCDLSRRPPAPVTRVVSSCHMTSTCVCVCAFRTWPSFSDMVCHLYIQVYHTVCTMNNFPWNIIMRCINATLKLRKHPNSIRAPPRMLLHVRVCIVCTCMCMHGKVTSLYIHLLRTLCFTVLSSSPLLLCSPLSSCVCVCVFTHMRQLYLISPFHSPSPPRKFFLLCPPAHLLSSWCFVLVDPLLPCVTSLSPSTCFVLLTGLSAAVPPTSSLSPLPSLCPAHRSSSSFRLIFLRSQSRSSHSGSSRRDSPCVAFDSPPPQ